MKFLVFRTRLLTLCKLEAKLVFLSYALDLDTASTFNLYGMVPVISAVFQTLFVLRRYQHNPDGSLPASESPIEE